MLLTDVIYFYTQMEKLGIEIWIDGGWGVDALLEKQTRSHGDLDIAIEQKYVQKVCDLLEKQGYQEIRKDNEWNFVFGDDKGHEIDLHVFILDENAHVTNGLQYPNESLTGIGVIGGHVVKCISPEHMVKFHTGYQLRDSDYKDVSALCKKFGIDYPEEYIHLK